MIKKRHIFISVMLLAQKTLAVDPAHLVASALDCSSCIDWRVSGVCFWLNCGLTGCSVESSVRVSHNIPDLLIAAYNGDSPLQKMTALNHPSDGAIGAADNALNFKNIDVIGHPAVSVFQSLWKTTGLWCDSEANPFQPYYLSSYSEQFRGLSWNRNDVETVTAVGHLFEQVGRFGKLYPRCGWTVQPDDVRAAALSAVRAAHVVTRTKQPHIYMPVSGSCGSRCWKPGEFRHDSTQGGAFQMLHPVSENQTTMLGHQDESWSQGKYNDAKKYLWALWRPYSCCQPKGRFLYSMNW